MAATAKNTASTGKGKATANNAPTEIKAESSKKVYGGYSFGYNATTHEWVLKGKADPKAPLTQTSTGKPVYACVEGRYVEYVASDGRKLRYAVFVYEEPTKAEVKAAEASAPAGVDAKDWAEFQAFQAFKKAQGK